MEDKNLEIGKIGFDEKGYAIIREPIIIKLTTYKNSKYLDIRKYYEKNSEWLPTQKGITLSLEHFNFLMEILNNNKEKIKEWFEKS